MENIEWEEDEDVGRPDHVYKWAKLKNLGFILGSTDILKYFQEQSAFYYISILKLLCWERTDTWHIWNLRDQVVHY